MSLLLVPSQLYIRSFPFLRSPSVLRVVYEAKSLFDNSAQVNKDALSTYLVQALHWVQETKIRCGPTKETVIDGIVPNDLPLLPAKGLYWSVPLTSDLIMELALANKIWAEVICHFWAEAFEYILWFHPHFLFLFAMRVACPEECISGWIPHQEKREET